MANKGLISIIIPAYNREKTIKRCIDSVLSADYKSLEIIVVDDGSEDKTWEIIQSYSDKRIKSIHIDNNGVSAARNVGIRMCTGEYIHFLDSDDFIDSTLYSTCIDIIRRFEPDVCLFDYNVFFDGQQICHKGSSVEIPKNTLLNRHFLLETIIPVLVNIDSRKECFIESFVWNKLFKRRVLEENHIFFDELRKRWEDRLFLVEYLKYSQSFYYLPIRGYYYVMGNSTFANHYEKSIFDMILQGSTDYSKIVGDLYDVDTDYAKNYYCRVFISTAVQQFGIECIDLNVLQKDIRQAAFSDRGQELFKAFIPGNRFEELLKESIIAKDSKKMFILFCNEYKQQVELINNTKKPLHIRIKNRIKRLIAGEKENSNKI